MKDNYKPASEPVAYYPSPEVKAFGEKVNLAMFDASIQHALGGFDGCEHVSLENFDEDVRPYVAAYLAGNNDSVALTYAAMRTMEVGK